MGQLQACRHRSHDQKESLHTGKKPVLKSRPKKIFTKHELESADIQKRSRRAGTPYEEGGGGERNEEGGPVQRSGRL